MNIKRTVYNDALENATNSGYNKGRYELLEKCDRLEKENKRLNDQKSQAQVEVLKAMAQAMDAMAHALQFTNKQL